MNVLLVVEKVTRSLTDGEKVVLLVVFVAGLVWFLWYLNRADPAHRRKQDDKPDPDAPCRDAAGLPDLPEVPDDASPAQIELLALARASLNESAEVVARFNSEIAESLAWQQAILEVKDCIENKHDGSSLTPLAQRYLLLFHHRLTNPPGPEEVAANREEEIAAADSEIALFQDLLSRPTATGEVRAAMEACLRNAEERRRSAEER